MCFATSRGENVAGGVADPLNGPLDVKAPQTYGIVASGGQKVTIGLNVRGYPVSERSAIG
jgi:hypothetical protein